MTPGGSSGIIDASWNLKRILFQADIPVWQHPDGILPPSLYITEMLTPFATCQYDIAWRGSHREEFCTLLTWGHANCEAGMFFRLLRMLNIRMAWAGYRLRLASGLF
jgi:hypothetical protein